MFRCVVTAKYYCILQEVTPVQDGMVFSVQPASPRVTKRKRRQPHCLARAVEDIPPVVHSYLAPPSPAVVSGDVVWSWILHDKESDM